MKIRQVGCYGVNWLAFAASALHSLAWPAGVVAVAVMLRRPIGIALSSGIRRVRAGPVEIEFDQKVTQVSAELRRTSGPATQDALALAVTLPDDDLARLAEASPVAAVITAYSRIEARLVDLLDSANEPSSSAVGGLALARLAHRHGLITDQTLSAIDGLTVLRNLAAHGAGGDVTVERARDFITLADAVLYALRASPGPGHDPGVQSRQRGAPSAAS